MPSDKKRITLYCENELYEKITYIAKQDGRSVSNYVQRILDREILKYELEHGEVKI